MRSPDGARIKKEGPSAPLILHVTGYAPVRLPPCLSLGTDGNLSVVVLKAGKSLVHQVAAKVGDIEPDGRTRPEGGHGRELLCEGELVRINVILIAGCPSVPAGVLLDSIACLEYGAGEVGPLVSRTDYEGVVVSGRM